MTNWQKRFAKKLETVRTATRDRFEEMADDTLDPIYKGFAEFKAEIDTINHQLRVAAGHHFELPEVNIPAAKLGEKHATRAYLFSSKWSWAEATRALISHKTYGGAP